MGKYVLRIALACAVLTAWLPGGVKADDVTFELSVSSPALSIGETAELNIIFNDASDIPALDIPAVDGIEFRYLGPSTSMTIINGNATSSVTHVYTVIPLKAGSYTVGPLRFTRNGHTYTSNHLKITVGQPAAAASGGVQAQAGAADGLQNRLRLVTQIQKEKIYLNEVVPVKIKLLVNGVNIRDVQYPQIEHDGLSLEGWGQHSQSQENVGGTVYDVIEFPAAFFAIRPGDLTFGPVQLKCNVLVRRQKRHTPQGMQGFFDDFFSAYEVLPVTATCVGMPLTVTDLPREGRPQDFSGAIGSFSLDVSAGPRDVRVGDPITVKVAVRGTGNLKTVTMPRFEAGDDFKVYDPQVKEENGAKIFEQVIMPLSSSVRSLPPVRFSFFDPDAGVYKTLKQEPIAITVAPPEKDEQVKIVEQGVARAPVRQESLGRDIVFIKDSLGRITRQSEFFYQNEAYRGAHLFPVALFFALFALQRRRRRLETDTRYARHLRAPKRARAGIRAARGSIAAGNSARFYDAVHLTLREYLGDKFHVTSGGITVDSVEELLRNKTVPQGLRPTLRKIFEACDMARYASGPADTNGMREVLKDLEDVIDMVQRVKV